MTTAQDTLADELTAEQTAARLDEAARFYLSMTGEDFKERWAAGTLDAEHPHVVRVVMLLPGA